MECDDTRLQDALDAMTVLSMTVCFVPRPRLAEVRYQDADGRLSSSMQELDGSFNHWYGRGGWTNNALDDDPDFSSLGAFAERLYGMATDENDRRFWVNPRLLSMTIDFTKNEDRVAEITYLERDGRITTVIEDIANCRYRFKYSHGGWKNVVAVPDIDFPALRSLANSLYELALRDRLYDDAG